MDSFDLEIDALFEKDGRGKEERRTGKVTDEMRRRKRRGGYGERRGKRKEEYWEEGREEEEYSIRYSI